MPIIVISIAIQVAFVIHIIKTGRSTTWIWVVVMLPMAGSIAYVIIELLPDLMAGRRGRNARKQMTSVVNPNKAFNAAKQNYEIAATVDNTVKFADECLNKELFEQAQGLYQQCLKGIYEYDPDIMFGLAKAEFGSNNFTTVKTILDDVISHNPDYKNVDAHLLFAKTVAELGDTELALKEFKVLDGYYPGAEASYRYAVLLKATGDHEQAQALFTKILHTAKISSKHYGDLNKQWISLAKKASRS